MPRIRFALLVLLCAGLWAAPCWAGVDAKPKTQAPSYSESVLYNFCGAALCTDGSMPMYGNLILGRDGNFYGTTQSGGNAGKQCGDYGCGTVFSLSPAGVFATLYKFCSEANCGDGIFPSSLIQGSDGNLYGVTQQGGANTFAPCGAGAGCGAGTLFRLSTSGVFTTLYSFCKQANCSDGAGPTAPPLEGADGNFYGTTSAGGLSACNGYGCGTVYQLTPSGSLTTLYRFCSAANCADGIEPSAALVEGADGNFYGTTLGQYPGASATNGPGQTAFKITPAGTLATLHTFCSQSNCTDGSGPASSLLLASDGNFYGTTNLGGADSSGCNGNGCGAVYKMSVSGDFSILYSFCDEVGCTLGNQPQSGLMQASDGSFYGAALTSQNLTAGGTVYQVTPSGSATLIYSFCNASNSQEDCIDGRSPSTLPIQAADGNLYGMTSGGGFNPLPDGSSLPICPLYTLDPLIQEGCGTVFRISASPAFASTSGAPIQMSLSEATVEQGGSVTLTWAVSNAFSRTMQQCNAFVQDSASGAGVWNGTQTGTLNGGLYSGQAVLTPIAAGIYTYALTCGGVESNSVTLTVTPPPLLLSTTTLPNGAIGQIYSTVLAATGGVAPYTWSLASGSLPAGLSLDANTGTISGTPTDPGTANFVVQVIDSEGTPEKATAGLSITIPTPVSVIAPSANATTIRVAAPGQSASAVLTVSNFTTNNINFSCSGLPSGASCSFSSLSGSGSSGSVTMTVTTTAPQESASVHEARFAGFSLPALFLFFASLSKRRRHLHVLPLVVIIGFMLNGCSGGGSSSGGTGTPGTPSGDSTLTVTATAGSQSAQTTFTLSVQ